MTFSTNPNDQYCLLLVRVDDLGILQHALKHFNSLVSILGTTFISKSLQRLIEEVNSTIDVYRRNSDEN